MNTSDMIRSVTKKQGFPGAVPVLIGSLFNVTRFENDLHDAGIAWRSVVESVSPDASVAVSEHFGMYRRWVVLVRESDYERATQIAEDGSFYPVSNLPVPFAGYGLCRVHAYELEPCSGCSTGWDWLAKSDEAERRVAPPRHPNAI